jgi:hypothetical protein
MSTSIDPRLSRLHLPPTLTVWDIDDHRHPEVAAAVLAERSRHLPMDEASTTALFEFVIAHGVAADLFWELQSEMWVLRDTEDSFVLVESNPFSLLVDRGRR